MQLHEWREVVAAYHNLGRQVGRLPSHDPWGACVQQAKVSDGMEADWWYTLAWSFTVDADRTRRLLDLPVWDESREDYVVMPPTSPRGWEIGDSTP